MDKKKVILSTIILLLAIGIMAYYYLGNVNNTITVQTNGGVLYDWQYELSDDNIVSVRETSKVRDKDLAGGIVDINYIIIPKKTGTTIMTLKYINITDNSIDKYKKYKIKVDKYMHVSIEKIGK